MSVDFRTRLVVGCMTGTSIDGLDAALVRIDGSGLQLRPTFVRGVSRSLGSVAGGLRDLAEQRPMTATQIAALSRDFAMLHADVVRDVLGSDRADLVVAHGQTVAHAPPVSWQLFNPCVVAHALKTDVVTDLRGADLAAGGQGAPITPLADWLLFRSQESTAVVNLGGFCNVTLLPGAGGSIADIRGRDVCACNHVLDEVARTCLNRPFDEDGACALAGRPDAGAVNALEHVLIGQSRSGRSLGTGDELASWIGQWRVRTNANDLAASATEALGRTIGSVVHGASSVLLAGGGARNRALREAIQRSSGGRVELTDARGVPLEFREAAEMAVLGALCQDRTPITLSAVTGVVTPPVCGVWAYTSG